MVTAYLQTLYDLNNQTQINLIQMGMSLIFERPTIPFECFSTHSNVTKVFEYRPHIVTIQAIFYILIKVGRSNGF